MKIKRKSVLRVPLWYGLLWMLNPLSTFADVAPDPINMHFTGEVIAGACELIVNGGTMAAVDFHTISTIQFNADGKTTPVPFTLGLKNCQTALATGVLVTFQGMQDSLLPDLLALDSSSVASGFAIGIETSAQQPLIINAAQGAPFIITEGNTIINLQAWLQKKSGVDITPGEFTATAMIGFEYQ